MAAGMHEDARAGVGAVGLADGEAAGAKFPERNKQEAAMKKA